MAISRTPKGTVPSKAATNSLTLSSVSMNEGDTLVVGLAYETDAAIVSVKYGNKKMKWVEDSGQTTVDTRVRIYKRKIRKTGTRDITVTWASTMSARVMFATSISEAGRKDVGETKSENTAVTDPDTGSGVTSTVANTISIAAFASLGPSGDTPGTAGDGHTLGQRVGTSGGPDASNVTIQETYEILSATGTIKASLTGATNSKWANTIVAFRGDTYTVSDAWYEPYDGHPQMEKVVFVIEDESSNDVFRAEIVREEFENMSDTEVEEYIDSCCVWYNSKKNDGAPSPDFEADSAFNARVASFINDSFTI